MLIDKVLECTQALNDAKNLQNNKLSVERYEKTVDKAIAEVDKIHSLVEIIQAINNTDYCEIDFTKDDITAIKDQINECGSECYKKELKEEHVLRLDRIIDKYAAFVEARWKQDASKHASSIEGYLKVLMPLIPQKNEAQAVLSAISQAKEKTPTVLGIEKFTENVKKAHDLADGYKLTPGVEEFIKKVKSGKATYADLSAEVIQWIKEIGIESKIKINF